MHLPSSHTTGRTVPYPAVYLTWTLKHRAEGMISLFFEEFYIEGYVHIFRVRQEPASLDLGVYASLLAGQAVFHKHFDSGSRTPPLFEKLLLRIPLPAGLPYGHSYRAEIRSY